MRIGDQTAVKSQAGAGQALPGQARRPVLSGLVPPLAAAHIPRHETGSGVAAGKEPGETAVLVPARGAPLGEFGGTGKTQLAAAHARGLLDARALDLLLWVNATGRDAVITAYAQAIHDVGGPQHGEGPEEAASAFLAWLAETERAWLVVFDDLSDPAVLDGLWPRGPRGRVLVTTRSADVAAQAPSPRTVEVGAFSPPEALGYLSARLPADPGQQAAALDLAGDLAFLPIALGLAGALMAETGLNCRECLAQIADRREALAAAKADERLRAVASTWSLSADLAGQMPPAGLAGPALALAAMLDPNGIPGAVFISQAACAYFTGCLGAGPVDEAQARAAMYNLARAGLVTIDASSAARTVRIHALVQDAALADLRPGERDKVARAAAAALLEAWSPDAVPCFEQALRDSTARLHRLARGLLWAPECHPVLLRAGQSLEAGGLAGPATAYWRSMLDTGQQLLGPHHATVIQARDRLAAAYEAAGRPGDAIALREDALAERERILGTGHPDTLTNRASLALAYRATGRIQDAIRLGERTLADSEHVMGPRHPDTLTARSDLAETYLGAGMIAEAIRACQTVLAGREQVLGPGHPATLAARAKLAYAYRVAGQPKSALPLYERALADRERAQGADHPDTIAARASLAAAYRAAGKLRDAIPVYKRTLADHSRVRGPDHPGTIAARDNLAEAYLVANKLKDAIPLYEQTLADRERMEGPGHPVTITARGNLASAYHSAGKLALAIPLYEQALAMCERVRGADHPDTLTLRSNLAHAYHAAGRMTEALAIFERTVADCERALGPDHPMTHTARENLRAASHA
jgi:tetratricopeptide (TPR) repeat protein